MYIVLSITIDFRLIYLFLFVYFYIQHYELVYK